jgi:hypothetical protein
MKSAAKNVFIMGKLQKIVITNLPKKLSGGFPNSKSPESTTRIILAWLQPLSVRLLSPDPPDTSDSLPCAPQVPSPLPYRQVQFAAHPRAMANFELDPAPWLPWGHHIIDGGPTRLPQTFYFPSQDPPEQHPEYCMAVIEPPQPPEDDGF